MDKYLDFSNCHSFYKTGKSWDECEDNEVIYIPEACFEALDLYDAIVHEDYVRENVSSCTKAGMIKTVREYFGEYLKTDKEIEEYAENIFGILDWACFETECEELLNGGEFE